MKHYRELKFLPYLKSIFGTWGGLIYFILMVIFLYYATYIIITEKDYLVGGIIYGIFLVHYTIIIVNYFKERSR